VQIIINFFILFMASLAIADDVSFELTTDKSKQGLQSTSFELPAGYHFNIQAPSKIEARLDGQWVKAQTLKFNGREVSAQWKSNIDVCHLRAELYVCDDGGTFCLPRQKEVVCEAGKPMTKVWSGVEKSKADELPKGTVGENKNFISNDAPKALELARVTHRPLLIDFYGIWCPPCNLLNETVFNSKEFNEWQKYFVLLKLDADLQTSWSLKSKFKVTGYPTVVFADERGDEIKRLIGAREKDFFVGEMKKIIKEKENSVEAKKKSLEKKNNPQMAFEVGDSLLGRGDFQEAHLYLLRASRNWLPNDPRRDKLLSAELGMYSAVDTPQGQRLYAELLKSSLEWFPFSQEAMERADEWSKTAKSLGDKEMEKTALNQQVKTATWFTSHPGALKTMGWIMGDIYQARAGANEVLGDRVKAKEDFGKAADAYLAGIKKAKLDETTERANNLERIYCLWKSGKVAEAKSLYNKLESIYPDEFTFYFQHARLLKESGENQAALEKANQAAQYAYGDNKLRVLAVLAEIYNALNQKDKAIQVLDGAMASSQLPKDQTIRTHRYYNRLKELKKEIQKE